jgi:hypothetical protein
MQKARHFHSKKIAARVRSMTKKPHALENYCGAFGIFAEMSRISPGD